MVKIQVPYDAKRYAGMAVVGYAIGDGGKVSGTPGAEHVKWCGGTVGGLSRRCARN